MSRVTSATEGGVSRTFAYDINGNRTSQVVGSATYPLTVSPTSNRLTSAQVPGQALGNYQYDSNGNVTSDGARVVLRWNAMGFAKQAVVAGASTDYQYDMFGQRVKKSGPAGTRYYVYAQDQVSLLGEYDANGTALTEYVYLDGVPVLALKAGSIAYLIPDHLGTPRAAKNASGALVWQWESDAFGNGAANEDPSGLGNFAVSLRFPGQVYDPETGLHYNNARYYDPSTGRYRSSDPIGLAGGLNTYLYANGRSTLDVDATGEVGLPGAVAGGLFGAGVALVIAVAQDQDFSKWQTWADIGIGGAAGALAGATGTYFSAGATLRRVTAVNAAAGAVFNTTAGVASNAMACKPLTDNLGINFVAGAVTGAGGALLASKFHEAGKAAAEKVKSKSPPSAEKRRAKKGIAPDAKAAAELNRYEQAAIGISNGIGSSAGLVNMTRDAIYATDWD